MIADGIARLGKREEGIGLFAPGLDGHADVARAGDNDPIAHRLAPGLEHLATYVRPEVGSPPGVGPDRDARHRLCRHPACVLPLSGGVEIVAGDTKVVERGKADGVFITTSGVGLTRMLRGPSRLSKER